MGNTVPLKTSEPEFPRPDRSIVHYCWNDARKSVLSFQTYCENVGYPAENSSDQISKPFTRHELRIAELTLHHKYKEVTSKISALKELLEKLDSSLNTNHDACIARDFLFALEQTRFSGIYPYKSAYISALKRLRVL